VRLDRPGGVLPVLLAGDADAGPRPDVRQGAFQLPVAAGVPDEHGGRGPADVPDEPEPRDGYGPGLPLDSRRRSLLDSRAARVADAPALRRRPGRLLRLRHEELLARYRGKLLRPLREPLAAREEGPECRRERSGEADHLLSRPH